MEKLPEARRVVEANFPDSIFVEDIEHVTEELVIQWSLKFSQVAVVAIGSGSPCQGVSRLNSDRRGALRDHRSCLFAHVPRISSLFKKAFPWAQVHTLAENVASMDYGDGAAMNEAYDSLPWYINADGISLANRPRLFWVSWELEQGEGATIHCGSDGRLPIEGEVKLKVDLDDKDFLEPGWERGGQIPLPTFTTSRPSPTPLRRPAGLKDCLPHELDRWRQDCHRFPPYQYKDCNCLKAKGQEPRVPSISEREAILGFPIGFIHQCMSKKEHGSTAHADCRLTLLGNSWPIGVVAWLWSCLFVRLGIIQPVSLQTLVTRLAPGQSNTLQGLLLRPPMRVSTVTVPPSAVLVRKLSTLVSMKGEDILLQQSSEAPVRFHRLRATIPAKLWRWRTIAGWQWKGNPEHINVLELRAVLTSIRHRAEELQQKQLRCIHLTDSLVVLHALTRGRSSSKKMRRTLMRLNSILLATGLHPLWGYVETHQNPADRPSRRVVKKKWVKVSRK